MAQATRRLHKIDDAFDAAETLLKIRPFVFLRVAAARKIPQSDGDQLLERIWSFPDTKIPGFDCVEYVLIEKGEKLPESAELAKRAGEWFAYELSIRTSAEVAAIPASDLKRMTLKEVLQEHYGIGWEAARQLESIYYVGPSVRLNDSDFLLYKKSSRGSLL